MASENGDVVEFPTDEYKGLDLNAMTVEEAEPLVKTPDPKKSKREKPPREPKPTAKKTTTPYRAGKFVKPLTEFYGMIAMGVSIKDPICAKALMANAESCAKAWDDAARTNTAIRRALEALTEGTSYTKLFAAHLPIALMVITHHKPEMLPEMFKISPDESEVNDSGQHAA